MRRILSQHLEKAGQETLVVSICRALDSSLRPTAVSKSFRKEPKLKTCAFHRSFKPAVLYRSCAALCCGLLICGYWSRFWLIYTRARDIYLGILMKVPKSQRQGRETATFGHKESVQRFLKNLEEFRSRKWLMKVEREKIFLVQIQIKISQTTKHIKTTQNLSPMVYWVSIVLGWPLSVGSEVMLSCEKKSPTTRSCETDTASQHKRETRDSPKATRISSNHISRVASDMVLTETEIWLRWWCRHKNVKFVPEYKPVFDTPVRYPLQKVLCVLHLEPEVWEGKQGLQNKEVGGWSWGENVPEHVDWHNFM